MQNKVYIPGFLLGLLAVNSWFSVQWCVTGDVTGCKPPLSMGLGWEFFLLQGCFMYPRSKLLATWPGSQGWWDSCRDALSCASVSQNRLSHRVCKRPTHIQSQGIYLQFCTGWQIHKATMMTVKTFDYLYILANKVINIHWLQVT